MDIMCVKFFFMCKWYMHLFTCTLHYIACTAYSFPKQNLNELIHFSHISVFFVFEFLVKIVV